ncbi:hypothetical protein ACFO8O_11805 [Hephaestia sp. GCM10023244]|uniref:hypothetical protein n=1 Tax=unclassified Hephaestia TaxID=2631281 RepID=UPI0020777F62|nr:hypothetical protein [Hephaestia sp. MAHUQ-44]MCM8731642.1 hypothetical protein [Hephaestia sp. MAHUQ-44]
MALPDANRRDFVIGSASLPLLSIPTSANAASEAKVEDDLQRYVGFGNKQAGGDGDDRCGAWLAAELENAGFAVERQAVSVPFFATERCEIAAGTARTTLWPQPIVRVTGPDGITGPLVRVDSAGGAAASLNGAIALVDLPYARWSTALAKPIRTPIDAAFARGAHAAIVVTNGPTGKIIALNTDGRRPMFPGPVALMAPDDAAPFFTSAMRGERATLHLTGNSGRRPAFNFVGRINRGKGRWLAVSTPRSGWFTCAGERGGGIAAWLHLARWASRNAPDHDLAFICNTGHEYEYLGAEESLQKIAPKPHETAFWLHLGANLAARDWHDAVGTRAPLPGTDSQRYLVVSPPLLPAARAEFAGLTGLEAPYSSDQLSAGELTGIIAAGYRSVAGVFGIHRFHHVAEDDAHCLSARAVAHTIAAFQRLVAHALQGG